MTGPRECLDIRSPDQLIRMTVGLRGPIALAIEPLALRRHGQRYVADAVVALARQAADRLQRDIDEWLAISEPPESTAHQRDSSTGTGRRPAVTAARAAIRESVAEHSAFADDHRVTARAPDGRITVTVAANRLTEITIDDGDDEPYARQRYPAPLLAAAIISLTQQAMTQLADDRVVAAREILAAQLGDRR